MRGLGAFSRLVLRGLALVRFVFNGFIKMLLMLFQLRKPSCREHVEKACGLCAERVRSMLSVSLLSGAAHVAECGTRRAQAERRHYQGSVSGTWGHGGANVWLQAVWKGHYCKSVSRK